jgi:hypothetical protein
MITIPADKMNASLIEFMDECLARVEAEVEIRLCAARRLRAEASEGKLILIAHKLDRRSLSKRRAIVRWRSRSRKRIKTNKLLRTVEKT